MRSPKKDTGDRNKWQYVAPSTRSSAILPRGKAVMAQRPTVTRPCRERQQRSSARPQRTCLQALPQRGASKHHHRGAKHRNNRALHARRFRAAAHGRGKPPAALVAALSSHEPSSTKGRKGGEIAAKAVVQLLFATGKSFTVDGLREKLREFFRQEVRAELRAVAALNNVELITALISCNRQLALVGLQLRILNGVVSLLTTEVHNKALAAYLSEQSGASGNLELTTATLEVLACIAFKQPISQAEIDRLFDADKRGLVVKLRDLKLVEEFAGSRWPLALRDNAKRSCSALASRVWGN